ncbi:MAG TPA: matrixin family metalloprotease [Gemmatimonadales bacterium]|nr:matrixin family metalloprotease [Gemmatimonadales bacterium]
MSVLIAAVTVFLVSAVLWNVFVRRPGPRPSPAPAPPPPSAAAPPAAPDSAPPRQAGAPESAVQAAPPLPDAGVGGVSYMVLMARSDARRRIRASRGLTYLNEIVAASQDSVLHRWDNRILRPVRVYLPPGTVANFQPVFLDAVRRAFQRWEDAGVPVRFNLDADTTDAEVRFRWRIQFESERTGQTEVQWDQDGHLLSGVVTLATFDPKGQPLTVDDMRVVALHEIGHLIGLDHSPDSSDVMFATTKARDLSARDIQTALLLYQLAPGSLR